MTDPRPARPRPQRVRRDVMSPDLARVIRALRRRAEQLSAEAAEAGVGTFRSLMAARISMEFRALAEEVARDKPEQHQ